MYDDDLCWVTHQNGNIENQIRYGIDKDGATNAISIILSYAFARTRR
jgi:hypothetical protein